MSFNNLFKNKVTNSLFPCKSYKQDLVLNNVQRLICQKTPYNFFLFVYFRVTSFFKYFFFLFNQTFWLMIVILFLFFKFLSVCLFFLFWHFSYIPFFLSFSDLVKLFRNSLALSSQCLNTSFLFRSFIFLMTHENLYTSEI